MKTKFSSLSFLSLVFTILTVIPAQAKSIPIEALLQRDFKLATPMMIAYTSVTDARDVSGFPSYSLKQDIHFFEIAKKQTRIFTNVDPSELPAGAYTFVLTSTGDLIFGLDDGVAQIGTKHFELAQGENVFAAGEYENGRFNLKSAYVSNYNDLFKGFEEDLAATMTKFFHNFSLKKEITYTNQPILDTSKTISAEELKKYCAEPEFYKVNRTSICHDFASPAKTDPACEAQLKK